MATSTQEKAPAASSTQHLSANHRKGTAANSNIKFGFLRLDDLSHSVRLRSRLRLADKLSAEIGADVDVTHGNLVPVTALEYQITRSGKALATLRADKHALYVQKAFPVSLFSKVSCRVRTTAAATYDGVPELGVGVDNLQPAWLIPVAGVLLLAAGKSISQSKTFGSTTLRTPGLQDETVVKGEVLAAVQRNGRGLSLSLKQLNAVLRV